MAELLKEERGRLSNSLAHLESSNCYLKAELDATLSKDADLKTAMEENIWVIAKYRAVSTARPMPMPMPIPAHAHAHALPT